MLSKREKLLIRPWQLQRYENHKRKVQSARPAIDFSTPPHYVHVATKLKKQQAEKERLDQIKKENIRLLYRLGSIMKTKYLENFWQHPRPNFLNREKIYPSRPKTSSGRIESVDTSAASTTRSGFLASRCPTCSGKPVKKNQVCLDSHLKLYPSQDVVIPEERIPWEPPRKSWNRKILNDKIKAYTCCKLCCRS